MVKFDGSGNFRFWQRKVKDLLVQQGLVKALYGKQLVGMDDMDWKELEAKAVATIRLCLADDVMYHVMDDESPAEVWLKLERKETLELEEITSALLGFRQRKKASDENTQGEGLVVKGNQERGRNKSRSRSSKNKARSKSRKRKDITCFKCRTKGHIKRDCLEKKNGNIENKEGPSKSANIVEEVILQILGFWIQHVLIT
ncbi:hypothetical protein I3842_15G125400 [Carya illinoinensis]|uniref:CCHC-type domain-containing protein n=1 Tax=Carya illinoinensis TaxID=32201 RepID=A0A922AFP7_CARIL|nr:hypothetical protein I3842_15G125400 [Carya illinoinensis]